MTDAAGMVRTYLRIAWRRLWLLILPLAVTTSFAYVALQRLPKVYRAQTMILVEPQNIPSEYVRPTVTESMEGPMKTIEQQITSRTRIEQVARDVGIMPPGAKPVDVERQIERIRSAVEIRVREERIFTVSFKYGDPQLAADVVNQLAGWFIEDNARGRHQQAKATSEFLEDELERKRVQLAAQETAISEFKRRHQTELPEQQSANLRNVDSLQRGLRDNLLSQQRSRDRKALLETQLSTLDPLSPLAAQSMDPGDPRVELARLRKELVDLKSRYTERYPDVQRVQRRITALEAQIADIPDDESGEGTSIANPAGERLQQEIMAVEMEFNILKSEETSIRGELEGYRRRLENAPGREQELLSLTRDYDTVKKSYQSLLNKQTEAKLAETLEEERKGEQFIVLDPAVPPARAYQPDPLQVMGAGVFLGLALGIGLIALLELLRPTFVSPQQIQEALGVPVVAAIPRLRTVRRGWWRKTGGLATGLLCGATARLLGELAAWMG